MRQVGFILLLWGKKMIYRNGIICLFVKTESFERQWPGYTEYIYLKEKNSSKMVDPNLICFNLGMGPTDAESRAKELSSLYKFSLPSGYRASRFDSVVVEFVFSPSCRWLKQAGPNQYQMTPSIKDLIKHKSVRIHKYDEINIVNQGGTEITYGITHGNNTIVFIKVGMNGSIYGYKNKYLKIAKALNKKHGCTVIVSSNPNGLEDNFESEMKSLKAYAYYHKWEDYQVYYMGHSLGATLGIINAWKYPDIKKLACINGPLFVDSEVLINGMKNFSGENMHLIYGSKDPSFDTANLFAEYESDKMVFTRIHGADHNFTGCLDLFMALPGFYFFGDEIKEKLIKG